MATIDELVEKISRNPEISKAIARDPRFRDVVYGRALQNYNSYSGLVKSGGLLDKIRLALGLGATAGYATSALGTVGFGLSNLAELVLGAINIPYSVYYGARTKDWKGAGLMAATSLGYMVPIVGPAIMGAPIYKKIAMNYVTSKTQKELEELLKQDRVVEMPSEPAAVPALLRDRHNAYVSPSNVLSLDEIKPKYKPRVRPSNKPYTVDLDFERSDDENHRGWHRARAYLPPWAKNVEIAA